MHFDPSPEETAVRALHNAVATVADPGMQFSGEQLSRILVCARMLETRLRTRPVAGRAPRFEDYLHARTWAIVRGSVSATYDGTEYVRAEDTHGPNECDTALADGTCSRCLDAYRRKYSSPQNQVNGPVSGVVAQARDIIAPGGLSL